MDVSINVIPHENQRYDTVGDWIYDPQRNHLQIFVSELGNSLYEQAIAMHEYFEVLGCIKEGITTEMVDEFDFKFSKEHPDKEPGCQPEAPYFRQHMLAESVEFLLIKAQFGMSWSEYNDFVDDFYLRNHSTNKENQNGNEASPE